MGGKKKKRFGSDRNGKIEGMEKKGWDEKGVRFDSAPRGRNEKKGL